MGVIERDNQLQARTDEYIMVREGLQSFTLTKKNGVLLNLNELYNTYHF